MKKPFMQTAFGSFLKILVTAFLGQALTMMGFQFAKDSNIFKWTIDVWQMIGSSGVGAALLVLKNWKDPKFPLYGKQPKEEIVVDNPKVAGTMQIDQK